MVGNEAERKQGLVTEGFVDYDKDQVLFCVRMRNHMISLGFEDHLSYCMKIKTLKSAFHKAIEKLVYF